MQFIFQKHYPKLLKTRVFHTGLLKSTKCCCAILL